MQKQLTETVGNSGQDDIVERPARYPADCLDVVHNGRGPRISPMWTERTIEARERGAPDQTGHGGQPLDHFPRLPQSLPRHRGRRAQGLYLLVGTAEEVDRR